MWCSMRVATLVVVLLAAASASPSYPAPSYGPPAPSYGPPPPPPCYPETKYVTQYQTKVQQVSGGDTRMREWLKK